MTPVKVRLRMDNGRRRTFWLCTDGRWRQSDLTSLAPECLVPALEAELARRGVS